MSLRRSVVACWIVSVLMLGGLMFGAVACGSDDTPANPTSEVEDEADDLEDDLEDEADDLEKEADELEGQLEQEADELEEDIRNP